MNDMPSIDHASNSFTLNTYVWFRWDPTAWPSKIQWAIEPAGAARAKRLDRVTFAVLVTAYATTTLLLTSQPISAGNAAAG